MQGIKRSRSTPSIANSTKIYGIMGGLAPRVGISDTAVYRHTQIKGAKGIPQLNGKTPAQQLTFLTANKLLSVNPLTSGGVGKRTLMFR
jgi:hypothetical protein